MTRPGEFQTENRKAHRNYDDCRSRRHDHHHANQEHRRSNDGDHNTASRLVREMYNSLDQNLLLIKTCSATLDFTVFCRSLGAMLKPFRLLCLLSALLCAAAAADSVLNVKAKEAKALIQPRDAQQQHVSLPALDVAVLATMACPLGANAESLTVSVSDTHRYFSADLLSDPLSDNAPLEAALSVPADQLAPVAIPDFCVSGEQSDDEELELPGIATAHISLRCLGDDDSRSVHFSSVSVPVRLYCRAEGDPDSSALLR